MWSASKCTCIYMFLDVPMILHVFFWHEHAASYMFTCLQETDLKKLNDRAVSQQCNIPLKSGSPWRWRDMCTVTVTGGAGFLGQHVIQHLQLSAPWVTEIRVFDLIPSSRSLGINFKICILIFWMFFTNAWQYMCLLYIDHRIVSILVDAL